MGGIDATFPGLRDRVHGTTSSGAGQESLDVLWIWRLRDGLVASVDIFEAPGRDPSALRHATPRIAVSP
jgi:hypothetical protein